MTYKVVVVEVDEELLKESTNGSDFETEMGWVAASGIHMEDSVEIPDVLESGDPIETAWIMREVGNILDTFKKNGEINAASKEEFMNIVKEIQNNYEVIEQDIAIRIRDAFGLES